MRRCAKAWEDVEGQTCVLRRSMVNTLLHNGRTWTPYIHDLTISQVLTRRWQEQVLVVNNWVLAKRHCTNPLASASKRFGGRPRADEVAAVSAVGSTCCSRGCGETVRMVDGGKMAAVRKLCESNTYYV